MVGYFHNARPRTERVLTTLGLGGKAKLSGNIILDLLPNDGLVNITIYDMMGRMVRRLLNGYQIAGFKTVQWDATNDKNEPVSAGLYLYTIQAGEFRQTKKMVLLK